MKIQNLESTSKGVKTVSLQTWLPLTLILLLATTLRLYQLNAESLWVDEFHSLRTLENLHSHVPIRFLYFVLLRGWTIFSTADAWLRGLSVLFGVGSVLLTYSLGYRLVGKATGLIAAFMLAASPLFIFHSQEVRMYMLSTFLNIAGTLAIIRAFEKPTIAAFSRWIAARILVIYSTPINLLLLLPDALLILLRFRSQRRRLAGVAVGLLVLGLLFLPIAPNFIKASQSFLVRADQIPGAAEIIGQLPAATVYWPMRQIPGEQVWFYGLYSFILLFPLGFLIFNKKRSSHLNWLAIWAFLPLFVLLLVSATVGNVWTPRYLLVSTPYLIVLLSAGFVQVWQWKRLIASAIAIVYAVALSGGLLHYYGKKNITDWRSAVQTINTNERVGDLIVVPTKFINDYVFTHYYSGSNSIYVVETLLPRQEAEQAIIEQNLAQLPIESRLWLLYVRSRNVDNNDTEQMIQNTIKKQFEIQDHNIFSGYLDTLDLFLLTPRSGSRAEQ
jgi:mannosyltransferase